jgi:hypothetical protein
LAYNYGFFFCKYFCGFSIFGEVDFFFVGINEDVVGIGNLTWISVSAKERLG